MRGRPAPAPGAAALRIAFVLVLLTLLAPGAEARRRSVRTDYAPLDPSTPAGWLALNAHRLYTTEHISDFSDLAPLGAIVGDADIVGLGDGTHGTHEFHTVKLRAIEYLVRELGFDTVGFEMSFGNFEKVNAYVQGGPGDPRALLGEAGRIGYYFWDSEEILAVIEWARAYNANRGTRPAVSFVGADIFEPQGAAAVVIQYLRMVDPAAATVAETDYQCVLMATRIYAPGCSSSEVDAALARLTARRADLGTGAGAPAYENALHAARVVTQTFGPFLGDRDRNMAENLKWIREHRSQTRRVIYWAHSEHVGKALSSQVPGKTTGMFLNESFGDEYVAIGTLTGGGQFMTWQAHNQPLIFPVIAPAEGTYEFHLQRAAPPAVLVPLRGELPSWLVGPANYFIAGSAPFEPYLTTKLPEKLDAVIYVNTTTPIRPLTH